MDDWTLDAFNSKQAGSAWANFWDDFTGKSTERAYNTSAAAADRNWQAMQAEIDREFNSAEAERARQDAWAHTYYETELANTAIQRQMEDAKKAGLNPYYLVSHASGGADSTGTSASATAAQAPGARQGSKAATSANNSASVLGATLLAIGKIVAALL